MQRRQRAHCITVWRKTLAGAGETLVNLANRPGFAKLKPSKLVLIINNLLGNLLIRQLSFTKCSKRVNSPTFPPAKVSLHTVSMADIFQQQDKAGGFSYKAKWVNA